MRCFMVYDLVALKNANRIGRTRNTTRKIQWCAREEKAPAIDLLALLAQFVEVKHLANRHPPHRQENVMETFEHN